MVPIPKAYYWETSNYNLPFKIKAWHRSVDALGKIARFAESAGDVAANIAGINSSCYDYVTATITEEQWERSQRNAEVRHVRLSKTEQECNGQELTEDVGADFRSTV